MAKEDLFSFDEMPFGFSSVEDFSIQVLIYVKHLEIDLSKAPDSITQGGPKNYIDGIVKHAKDQSDELSFLRDKMNDPESLYNEVHDIYDRIVLLEHQGLSRREIATKFLDDGAENIWPLGNLLEHGMEKTWGYRFFQALTAVNAVRSFTETKPKQ